MRNNWSKNANYMMIDGGPWGTSHQHMDKLSFVLTSQGVDFITDPCNTLYANNEPDARLSTLHAGFMHNTITVDGADEFVRGADEMATDEPLNNRWECGENWVLFAGEYDFSPVKAVLWKRRVLFVDWSYWILQDVLIGTGMRLAETLLQGEASCSSRSVSGTAEGQTVDIEQNFQFEEDIAIELSGNDAAAVSPGGKRLLLKQMGGGLVPEVIIGEEASRKTYSTQYSVYGGESKEFGHGRGWISRVINKILPAPAIVYGGRALLPTAITLAIVPETEDQIDIAAVRAADECGATVWTLPTRNGNLELLTSTERFEVSP